MGQCRSPLGWLHLTQQESKADLEKLLAQTTFELESTIVAARDEISRKDKQIFHMKDLLAVALQERDQAHLQFQNLLTENLSLQQQLRQLPKAVTNAVSLSSSSNVDAVISASSQFALGKERALPEKGKLLQAVIEAGPTLETLLLAGRMPEWQQPPPKVDVTEIPPVEIVQDSSVGQKGSLVNNSKKRAR